MIDIPNGGAVLALVGGLWLAGCGETLTSISEAGGAPDKAETGVEAIERAKDIDAKVDAFMERAPELLQAPAAEGEGPMARALAERREALWGAARLEAVYGKADPRSAFVQGGRLTAGGRKVAEALSGVGAEGLKPEDYHAVEIAALIKALEGKAAPPSTPALTEAQRAALAQALGASAAEAEQDKAAAAALIAAAPGTAAEGWIEGLRRSQADSAGEATALELLLADGVLRYAHDLKHFSGAQLTEEERAADFEAVVQGRQERFFEQLRKAARAPGAAEAVAALLEGLRPSNPQYRRLMEALARYEAIAAAGGWPAKLPQIPRPKRGDIMRYKPGFKKYPDELVSLIKARLAGERLYDGPIDEVWDDALSESIQRYRRNNLMQDFAWIDYEMVEAMKVPAIWRAAQIKLNLQRLREDRIGDARYYVYVNVPEFFAEVWDVGPGEQPASAQPKLKMRFPIVVGSRKKYREKKTGLWRFPDATPILTDRIEKVIFNPYWTVPPRIRAELKRKAEGKPDYWKENGYEVLPMGNGGEMIRQKPGPDNALGQVKFVFPNDEDIYMHDTARKDLFREEIRAFSHGCMRVHEPLNLAFYLLHREDNTWTERRVRINAGSGQQFQTELKAGPSVFTDYVTVRVDEAGEVRFLWDIYQRDTDPIVARYGLTPPEFDPHYP